MTDQDKSQFPDIRLLNQIELQLLVNSIDPFVVPAKSLHVAQIQKTEHEAPIAVALRQHNEPLGDFGVFIAELRLIAITGLADHKNAAGRTDVQPSPCNSRLRHLATTRRLHHFFAMASLITSF